MFIVELTYIAPIEAADAHMEPHMAWVKEGYDRGWFLASGRKNPRSGGVILASGERAALEAFLGSDPFAVHGIAEYRLTEMVVTRTAPGLEALQG